MSSIFFDFNDDDFGLTLSGHMGVDFEGNMVMRMSDHMIMDMESGDVHIISLWPMDDNDD